MSVLKAIMAEPWAIQPEALETIIGVAQGYGDPEALEARLGRPLQNTHDVTVRDGVAVVPIIGPIFQRANLFTRISGATSTELLARDITAALENPNIRGIVLNIDSPGGQAPGIAELADMIQAGRAIKPITAYVGGTAASAAYWLASAATDVAVSDTALLGSIGVAMVARIGGEKGVVEIVSARAPHKRPDAATDEGRAKLQAIVDKLENVFINAVARNRGVDSEKVITDFGQGGILVGAEAVKAGMVDRLGSFEGVIAQLQRGDSMSNEKAPAITLDYIKASHPDIASALKAEGETAAAERIPLAVNAERERIQAVFAQGKLLPGHNALIEALMFDGKTTGPEAAVQILSAESKARAAKAADLLADAPKPAPVVASQTGDQAVIDANAPLEKRAQAEWDKDPTLRAEFGDIENYLAYKRANEAGRAKILSH